MRYRLRTLMIVLALGPPVIALAWWYGRVAIGVFLLAILVCPELIFGAFVYTFGALCHLLSGKPIRDMFDDKK
jgi:hypothetical protein